MNENAYVRLHSVFHSFQGEGLYTGVPCVFVRFQGCSVGCPFCDTKEAQHTNDTELVHIDNVVRLIEARQTNSNERIVITGGEPFEQQEALHRLLMKLMYDKRLISIETSGTVGMMDKLITLLTETRYRHNVHITLSPKHLQVYPEYISLAKEYKILLADNSANDIPIKEFSTICTICKAKGSDKYLYFQPTWYKDVARRENSLKRAMKMAMLHQARLSVQVHKYLNIM